MTGKQPLKIFIVAGEESGDLHGSKLVHAINKHTTNIQFTGHGGDRMANENVQIIEHINDLAIIGFVEVIKHLPYMFKVMGSTVNWLRENNPDRLILIDYPGFNLRLAREAVQLGIPVTYFILPQVWAWKEGRVSILRDSVDQCLSIIPFEQEWFENKNVKTNFVGHPFIELEPPKQTINQFLSRHNLNYDSPILTLFPGSRQQEINQHWPIYIKTVKMIKSIISNIQVIVGKAPGVNLPNSPDYIKIEENDPQLTMYYGDAALVASGTATLEAAVLDIPMVVSYRFSLPTWIFAKKMATVSYASMVNLIANEIIVPEFIQSEMTSENLTNAVIPLLNKTPERKKMLLGYEKVRRTLGMPGVYDRAAKAIINRLK